MHRHPSIAWKDVQELLVKNPEKLESLHQMQESQGEPDVVRLSQHPSQIVFVDCSKESPKERRSLCYDHQALHARKQHKPESSAVHLCQKMGIALLDEQDYLDLQDMEDFDIKSSSWLHTPEQIRSLGGAIFGDKRFSRAFIYHNGADSYYAARGFRGKLIL